VRTFFGWAAAQGLLETDPAAALPVPPRVEHLPRPAPEAAVHSAVARADGRVRLMIALAVGAGLRRGEISRVHARDLECRDGAWTLLVHGKGGRSRRIALWRELGTALRSSCGAGWAFPGGCDGHLSPGWVGTLVTRSLPEVWTTHTLRHRFATALYRATRDIYLVQRFLGHSRPETTQSYVLVADEDLQEGLVTAAAGGMTRLWAGCLATGPADRPAPGGLAGRSIRGGRLSRRAA
jgi:integrase